MQRKTSWVFMIKLCCQAGLATAPVLLAAEEHPRLQTLIDRKVRSVELIRLLSV